MLTIFYKRDKLAIEDLGEQHLAKQVKDPVDLLQGLAIFIAKFYNRMLDKDIRCLFLKILRATRESMRRRNFFFNPRRCRKGHAIFYTQT